MSFFSEKSFRSAKANDVGQEKKNAPIRHAKALFRIERSYAAGAVVERSIGCEGDRLGHGGLRLRATGGSAIRHEEGASREA